MAKKKAKKKAARKAAKKVAKKAKKAAGKPAKKASKEKAASSAGPTVPLGGIVWSEAHVSDPQRIVGYYSNLLGWKSKAQEMPGLGTYHMVSNKGTDFGGIFKAQPGTPPMWLTYFSVANVDSATKKAEQLGGKVVAPPMDIGGGMGRFSILSDPDGAVFALWAQK